MIHSESLAGSCAQTWLPVTAIGSSVFFATCPMRDKLFARWLGAAIPRLAEKWDRPPRAFAGLNDRRIKPGCGMCRLPNALEHNAREILFGDRLLPRWLAPSR